MRLKFGFRVQHTYWRDNMDNKQLDESKDFPLIEPEIDKKKIRLLQVLKTIYELFTPY